MRALVALALLFAALPVHAQTRTALWSDVSEASLRLAGERVTVPETYRVVRMDRAAMATALAAAPDQGRAASPARLTIPLPEGGFVDVSVVEASIMAPELQARFPEIRTYLAQGPGAVHGRLSHTPAGFRGMLFTPHGTIYVDPYARGTAEYYVVYRAAELRVDPALRGRIGDVVEGHEHERSAAPRGASRAHGATLRTYRLAVAATGEYTAFHGGTVSGGLAAVVTTFNRVTGIYEKDLSVSFQLVANNNLLIYTNAGTDPYSNTSGDLNANQTNINTVIGSANYDVGHLVGTGGGGVAQLAVICGSSKARGLTGSSQPVGDAFDVDYVAHELGHQFGGNHTFNGSSGSCAGGNRNGSTAYEPGSGSTIQAYAGICGAQNLQPNSDAYFHAISLDEMTAHVTTGSGGTCGTATTTNNPIPTVTVPASFTIPIGTPFTLTGSATDNTPSALTYTWEEMDLGPAGAPGSATPPLFRSFLPTASPSRTFPQFSRLLAGQAPVIGETLPTTSQTLNFRLTARDNRPGGGAINDATTTVTTVASAGPFTVTFATTAGQSFPGTANVTWNVAGTNAGAVNTPTVDILFSTNNGNAFDYVLAAGTPNDGSQTVSFPASTTQGRILIRAVGNVFFNVNPQPFTVTSSLPPPSASVAPGSVAATLAPDATTTRTVTVSNTAAPGSADLSWSATVLYDDPLAPGTPTASAAATEGPKGDARADGTGATSFGAGGPDAFGYTWADSNEPGGPTYSWVDISATGTAVTLADDGFANVALPFAFPFYGTDRTSINIVSNGWLNFGTGSTEYTNAAIPTSGIPNNLIAPFWDDLDPSSGGSIRYRNMGDGRFVVSWIGVPRYNNAGSVMTFQAILYATGEIVYQYQTMSGTTNSATVGIEDGAGTVGLQVVNNAAYVANSLAVRFTFVPPPPPLTWLAVSPSGGTVAPGASSPVTLTLDADGLDEGVYTATLRFATNDPANGTVDVPVTLTVSATTSPTYTVTEPLTGASILAGAKTWVRWTGPGVPDTADLVSVYLRKGTGPEVLLGSGTNRGRLKVTIPGGTVTGSDYTFVVRRQADPSVYGASDPVIIYTTGEQFTFTEPDGGETWQRGTTKTIGWTTPPSAPSGTVTVRWYRGSGLLLETYAGEANDGALDVAVPSDLTTGDFYFTIVSDADPAFFGQSNVFSIQRFEGTAPAEGATWAAGSSQTVSWTSGANAGGQLRVALRSRTTGTTTVVSSYGPYTDFSRTITVPGVPAGEYEVQYLHRYTPPGGVEARTFVYSNAITVTNPLTPTLPQRHFTAPLAAEGSRETMVVVTGLADGTEVGVFAPMGEDEVLLAAGVVEDGEAVVAVPSDVIDAGLLAQTGDAEASSVSFGSSALTVRALVDGREASVGTAALSPGEVQVVPASSVAAGEAPTFAVAGVVPNPTSGGATVRFTLPSSEAVTVTVYDMLGRTVATLFDGTASAGANAVAVPASLNAGVYVVRVSTASTSASARFTVIR